jgi:hypothetical protein
VATAVKAGPTEIVPVAIVPVITWDWIDIPRTPVAARHARNRSFLGVSWKAVIRWLMIARQEAVAVPARRRPVIELDNNPVERAIRPIALGRKNHLFAGSDGGGVRWATVCSLIATAKLNNVEPFAWLSDVLQRMTDGHPANRLDELLPWNWQPINGNA